MPLAYYLILNTPNLSVHLEIFLSLWKGGGYWRKQFRIDLGYFRYV